MRRNVYVAVTYSGSPDVTRTFSIFPDETGEGNLLSPLTYKISVRTWLQEQRTSSSVSSIKICNANGLLDSFVDEDFIDVTISENVNGTVTQLAYGVIDRVVLDSDRNIIINLKDATKLLDIPMQNSIFPENETSISDGTKTNEYYAMENQPRPISLGRPKNINPVLAKRSINEYHINDTEIKEVSTVYDNGVSVGFTEHDLGFTLTIDPVGMIVARVRGGLIDGTTSDARTFKEILDYVFDKVSFTDFSSSDLTAIDSEKGYRYGYYQDNTSTAKVSDLVKWMCDSQTGWYYADSDGDIRFGFLKEPDVTADIIITQLDTDGGINVFDDTAPNISTKVGSNKNFYVHQSDQIAAGASDEDEIDFTQNWIDVSEGVNTLDSFYQDTGIIFDSLIQPASDGQDEADNITSLYSEKRKFYAFDSTKFADIGETVNLTYPRYGLESGVNLLCVGYEIDFIFNNYKLILWG